MHKYRAIARIHNLYNENFSKNLCLAYDSALFSKSSEELSLQSVSPPDYICIDYIQVVLLHSKPAGARSISQYVLNTELVGTITSPRAPQLGEAKALHCFLTSFTPS